MQWKPLNLEPGPSILSLVAFFEVVVGIVEKLSQRIYLQWLVERPFEPGRQSTISKPCLLLNSDLGSANKLQFLASLLSLGLVLTQLSEVGRRKVIVVLHTLGGTLPPLQPGVP